MPIYIYIDRYSLARAWLFLPIDFRTSYVTQSTWHLPLATKIPMYVYMYVCIHVCMYTCMYVNIFVRDDQHGIFPWRP